MTREKLTLDQKRLADISNSSFRMKSKDSGFSLHENVITSSDTEDGGADHDVVFKRESDGKYFKFSYTDWDMDYNFDRDFPTTAREVFPKTISTIVFE
jgi:hypothetical protein